MKRLSLEPDRLPVDGALGLLAHGDLGLTAWRERRAALLGPDWRARLAHELAQEARALEQRRAQGDHDAPD